VVVYESCSVAIEKSSDFCSGCSSLLLYDFIWRLVRSIFLDTGFWPPLPEFVFLCPWTVRSGSLALCFRSCLICSRPEFLLVRSGRTLIFALRCLASQLDFRALVSMQTPPAGFDSHAHRFFAEGFFPRARADLGFAAESTSFFPERVQDSFSDASPPWGAGPVGQFFRVAVPPLLSVFLRCDFLRSKPGIGSALGRCNFRFS
jgi:hypothetical protein